MTIYLEASFRRYSILFVCACVIKPVMSLKSSIYGESCDFYAVAKPEGISLLMGAVGK